MTMSSPTPIEINVTDIGEYIRHRSCDRRFHLTVNYDREVRYDPHARTGLPFFDRLLNTLDPVLQEVGRKREDQWEGELRANGFVNLTDALPKGKRGEVAWAAFAAQLAGLTPGTAAYGRQVQVGGILGAFKVAGNIDFVLLRWVDGSPRLFLVECKASRRDRTYHRVQVGVYRMLMRQMMGGTPVPVGGTHLRPDAIECVVARIDEDSNTNQSIHLLPPLDLASEEADVERLLACGGRLDAVAASPLDGIGYQIDSKCDGCVFNVHCLAESARLKRPELIGLDPVSTRLLRGAGLDTLDKLADPPVFDTPPIAALRRDPGFSENFDLLRLRARARRHTLPGGRGAADEHDVEAIPNTGFGHLPPHEMSGRRVVRIYMVVDYDYSENRIGALSAHVTRSEGRVHTRFTDTPDGRRPDPVVYERVETGKDAHNKPVYDDRPLPSGQELVEIKTAAWKGNNYEDDTAAERELIQRFFHKLVGLIAREAGQDAVPIHFYVWSQLEVRQLIEGCCRAGSQLLGHLRQLLGCREGLEQLIYSSVQDEIDRRYALGWTGRGLGVVASLMWYGRRYHWKRLVNGRPYDLDYEFTQNLFDFKTQLDLDPAGGWAEDGQGTRHTFEIRSRFQDSLPAAYWHALWRTLPTPGPDADHRLRNAIERFNRARIPNLLEEYLRARCHALRWLEEGVRPKNAEIEKTPLTIADLPDFHLGRDDVARSAVDFLRLDQQVKKSNWIAFHLLPPVIRVPLGRTLPLKQVRVGADKKTITGTIELYGFGGLTLADLETRCSFAADSFVRLSPWSGDPKMGQTVKQLTTAIGRTCVVQAIDWKTGQVTLDSMYAEEDRYLVSSGASKQAEILYDREYATLDESVSDYVAGRVDARLQAPSHVYAWFDPVTPQPPPVVPPSSADLDAYRRLVAGFLLPPANRYPASPDQAEAVIEGLETRISLLLGPPGTGKTTTTALAILVRVLAGKRPGDIVLLSAHTHTALDNLLKRLDQYLEPFRTHAAAAGLTLPAMKLVKVHSNDPTQHVVGGSVENLAAARLGVKKKLTELTTGAVLVVGGTTASLLKLNTEVTKLKTWNAGRGLAGSLLVVDEASMMVFPHFLALATLVTPDGQVMLTGDHRQLAPITAHDWENEDRPPTVIYQPYVSAYDAVRRIIEKADGKGVRLVPPSAARQSALRLTFRLPPVVRELIARIYRQDQIELAGRHRDATAGPLAGGSVWDHVWRWNVGLFLVVHDEDRSKRSNEVEFGIVEQLLAAAPGLPPASVAIITPHRAQRSLFNARLAAHAGPGRPVDLIDTVERLQGGERPTVVVSATVSDPTAIEANVEFILDLNRANVAFSRVMDRLVVVCSRTLLNHIPAEVEHYQSAMLWKSLRELCSVELARTDVSGHRVAIMTPPPEAARPVGP
jgi:hypothetical protein